MCGFCEFLNVHPSSFYYEPDIDPKAVDKVRDEKIDRILELCLEMSDYNREQILAECEMRLIWQNKGLGKGIKDDGGVLKWGVEQLTATGTESDKDTNRKNKRTIGTKNSGKKNRRNLS